MIIQGSRKDIRSGSKQGLLFLHVFFDLQVRHACILEAFYNPRNGTSLDMFCGGGGRPSIYTALALKGQRDGRDRSDDGHMPPGWAKEQHQEDSERKDFAATSCPGPVFDLIRRANHIGDRCAQTKRAGEQHCAQAPHRVCQAGHRPRFCGQHRSDTLLRFIHQHH